jgi:hypothetical protein
MNDDDEEQREAIERFIRELEQPKEPVKELPLKPEPQAAEQRKPAEPAKPAADPRLPGIYSDTPAGLSYQGGTGLPDGLLNPIDWHKKKD